MTPEAIDQYLGACLNDCMKRQSDAVKAHGLDAEDLECWISNDDMTLEVSRKDGSVSKFPMVPVGTYVETVGAWRWAFSDFGYPVEVRKKLGAALESAAAKTGFPGFVDPESIKCERMSAEALMAAALTELGADWFYALPSHGGKVVTYFAVTGAARVE